MRRLRRRPFLADGATRGPGGPGRSRQLAARPPGRGGVDVERSRPRHQRLDRLGRSLPWMRRDRTRSCWCRARTGTFTPDRLGAAPGSTGVERVLCVLVRGTARDRCHRGPGRARGRLRSCFLDPAPARDVPRRIAGAERLCDAERVGALLAHRWRGLGGEDDLAACAGPCALEAPARVIGNGGAGSRAGGRAIHRWPHIAVRAVDTTAAGDAFNGALAVGLADGQSIEDAGRMASAAGRLSVTRKAHSPACRASTRCARSVTV